MIRVLLILAAVLLLPGLSAQAGLWSAVAESPVLQALQDDDCCPDDCCPDSGTSDEDCCDGSACGCSVGVAARAAARSAAEPDAVDVSRSQARVRLPLHLLHPRANGPPEHPPPIV